MADIPRLANNTSTIKGYNTGSPRKAPATSFNDIPMGSFAPMSASPGDNVFGAPMPSSAPAAASTMAPAAQPSLDSVELGSEQWQQIKLAQAVEQLKREYGQLAARNGGSLNDPYWAKEYNDAVQEMADSISAEASQYRQVREESARDRDLTAQEGAANRNLESELSADRLEAEREAAKDAERSSMYQSAGSLGLGLLLHKREAPNYGTTATETIDPTTGLKTVTTRPNEGPKSQSPMQYLASGFRSDASPTARFLGPSLVGSGIGALAGGAKRGAWSSLASGMAGGGLSQLLLPKSSGPWSNLIASTGAAYANPFSKKSWGKNTAGTLLKLGATGAGSYLFGR